MPDIALMMGSDSDLPALEPGIKLLKELGLSVEARVLSAHRTPTQTQEFIAAMEKENVKVFICAAGMAAHLAGAVAAHTPKPVIGIPVASGPMNGTDALHATVMMPPGVPVATVGINGAVNAAILAAQMIGTGNEEVAKKVIEYRYKQTAKVLEKNKRLQEKLAAL
ncbi:MAG: 5-(carboxyamino)imidazole ribonucleotide mutase [Planctomycetota bacterium]